MSPARQSLACGRARKARSFAYPRSWASPMDRTSIVHYSAAKAGVVGLVRGLAVELARDGVRVNGVAPGYIRTAQLLSQEHSLGPKGAEAARVHPNGPDRRAGEIADVIVFLASNAARYMTGRWSWWTADCWLGGTDPGACAPPLPSTMSPMGDGASALTDRSCCTTFQLSRHVANSGPSSPPKPVDQDQVGFLGTPR